MRPSRRFPTRRRSHACTCMRKAMPPRSACAALILSAAAAPASGLRLAGGSVARTYRRAPAPVAKDGGVKELLHKLAGLTTVGLYATMFAVSGSGLLEKVPKLLSSQLSGGQVGDVVLDGVLFGVAGLQLAKTAGLAGKVDYAALEGREVNSLAREAGEWARAGEVPATSKDGLSVATFAGGCFWGTELHYQRMPGVVATAVGYTQGAVEQPTYEQVCSGTSGHTEALQLLYQPEVVSYERLCEKLLSTVDPTAPRRVDLVPHRQSAHGLYPHTDEQAAAAARVVARAQAACGAPIVTEVERASVFWPAEGYHQRYLEKGGQSAAKNEPQPVRCYG